MAIQSQEFLKTKFETGDFPTQTDFQDLIDSCFNYSLSDAPEYITFLASVTGNWEDTYLLVDAKRYEWDSGYNSGTVYSNNSGTYVTNANLKSNYLPLTGGNIAGNLSIQNNILSAGQNLLNIFLTPSNGYQSLTYNETNYNLTISSSNSTVNLSSLKTIVEIPFTHAAFTPGNNKTLVFGQLPITPSETISFTNCYRSFYSGQITEATLQNSYTIGSSETNTFYLVNRTKNLSATLFSNITYTDNVILENTSLNNTLLAGLPAGWVGNNMIFNSEGANFLDNTQVLITPSVDLTKYYTLSVIFDAAGAPGGTSININYSQNGGSSYASMGTVLAPQGSFKRLTANLIDQTFSNEFKLKFTASDSATMKNLSVIGFYATDTKLQYTLINPPLTVSKGDLLDVRLKTPTYNTAPTNLLNIVNAKLEIG